jgi:hypothetical protein
MTLGVGPRTAFLRSIYAGISNHGAQVPQSTAAREVQRWPMGRDFR